MAKKQINVRLDEHLIQKIHESGLSTTEFIEKSVTNSQIIINEESKIAEIRNVRVIL